MSFVGVSWDIFFGGEGLGIVCVCLCVCKVSGATVSTVKLAIMHTLLRPVRLSKMNWLDLGNQTTPSCSDTKTTLG